ncbi:uncharacterized protein [Temnothorax nylanderi]|uniref:uncharacterized protein n=1 Tax=Temnothorax nylanderi TaxID=102681 RepID=UPI003A8B6ECA
MEKYPEACQILLEACYMDDVLYGNKQAERLRQLRLQLIEILASAGFMLHKWNTNEPSILESPSEPTTLEIGKETKTLGVCWNTADDSLQYKIQVMDKSNHVTKRSILSTVAQIFDPLGLMGPTIIRAKIILQQLWRLKLGWDESLPIDLHTTWLRYRETIKDISLISIRRHAICKEPRRIEMHGFCDASEAAYRACIYIRSINDAGEISVHLLCAKSRVTPLKRITLPRLELQGALLLVDLGETVQQAFHIEFDSIEYRSDSTIVLAWLKRQPEELQTFVANQVANIQRIAAAAQWSHVRSKDNPADVISRGTTPENLKTCQLWWNGPPWLGMDRQNWPASFTELPDTEVPDLRRQAIVSQCVSSDFDLIHKFSSLSRLKADL